MHEVANTWTYTVLFTHANIHTNGTQTQLNAFKEVQKHSPVTRAHANAKADSGESFCYRGNQKPEGLLLKLVN